MNKEITIQDHGYNEALEWAAQWLLDQASANNAEVRAFATNISASIRAHKKPWGVKHSLADCRVCGIECDGWKDGVQPFCPEHCPDHDYEYVPEERHHECKLCFQQPPRDWCD